MKTHSQPVGGLLVDLDGTVYRGDSLVDPDVPAFFRRAAELEIPFLFVTNRSNRTPEGVAAHLCSVGVETDSSRVFTSAMATAEYLTPGRVYAIGEAGLYEALQQRGFEFTAHNPDYVVVGFDRSLTYEKIDTASRLIREGAQFIATNTDALVAATADRDEPGNAAAVAAISSACGAPPVVTGKPNRVIFEQAIRRLGCEAAPPDSLWMIGDNPNTDIRGAVDAGLRAAWYNPDGTDPVRADSKDWKNRVTIVRNYRELSCLLLSNETGREQ